MSKLDFITLPDNTPVGFIRAQPVIPDAEPIGTFGTIKNVFKRENIFATVGSNLYDKGLHAPPPNDEEIPEGWKGLNTDSIVGIPKEYWSELALAHTPKELEIIKSRIQNQMDLDERISRGGLVGRLAGSLIAGAIDPLNLVPIYGQLKFAKVGAGFIYNSLKAAPQVALTVGLSEAAIVASQETKNSQDWIWNTLSGAIVGSVFIGGIKGIRDAKMINKQTQILNAIDKDIAFKADLGEKGEFRGYKAEAAEGGTLSSAKATEYENLVNDGLDIYGEEFFKRALKYSPNARLLTSPYETAKQWAVGIFDNSWVTKKIQAGIIPEVSAERKLIGWQSLKDNILYDVKQMWIDSLDYNGPAKGLRSHFEKTNTYEAISEQASIALRSGDKSDNPLVQQVVTHVRKELLDKIYQQFVDRGLLKAGQKPAADESWFMRIWDRDVLSLREDDFLVDFDKWMSDRNAFIENVEAPVRFQEQQINTLKSQGAAPELIKEAEARLKELQTDIDQRITSGEISAAYTEGRPTLDLTQETQLRELTKSLREAEARLETAKTKDEIKAAKEAIVKENLIIEEKIANKEVHESLFYVDSKGRPHLADMNEPIKLAPIVPQSEWRTLGKSYHTSLSLLKDEQVMAEAFGHYSQGGVNPLKARTVLLPSANFSKYIVNDLNKVVSIYTGFAGRRLGLHDVFTRYGSDVRSGKEAFAAKLNAEREAKRKAVFYKKRKLSKEERELIIENKIKKAQEENPALKAEELRKHYEQEAYTPHEELEAVPHSKERDKEIAAIDKEFKKTLEDINDSYKVFMGNYADNDTASARVLKSGRDLAASTMRGAVLLVSLGEFFAPIFKEGPWTFIQRGLTPTLKYLAANKTLRHQDFADAGIAVETALGNKMDQVWGDGTHYNTTTVPEKVLANAAKVSGNVFLINQLTDFNKSVVASMAQAKIIRLMEKHLEGKKLTQNEIEYLGLLRLSPDKWAKRIMNEFNTPGVGERIDGSYVPNLRKWKDFDAVQAFRAAMSKEVDMVISKPSMLDIPFVMRNPLAASIMQFTSWSFGATANYVLPLLQRPDANKVTSMFLMMSAGSLVGAMRQLAAGEEVDLTPETLFKEAFFNSGVLGIHGDIFARVAQSLDLPFTPHRYKRKTVAEILAGPVGGVGQLIADLSNAVIAGQITEGDAKKALRLVPFMNAFYLRQLNNKWIESLNLAKRRGGITPE